MLKDLIQRPRRLRQSKTVRDLVHETDLSISNLIQPYFLDPDPKAVQPIKNFSGVNRWGVESLMKQVETQMDRGLKQFLLFGFSKDKDEAGSSAYAAENLVSDTCRRLKSQFGKDIVLFSDVCLCPYTSHGHCGLIKDEDVHNDSSVELLCQMALRHAEAGVDFVAPSDMMDGRVGALRTALDQKGHSSTGILSYTAKFRSHYYGPFREALDSSPQKGDRATYQMDFRNAREALRELELDLQEGADLVMVKPALAYLDIIRALSEKSPVPVVAYSVSGEYQMVKLAAQAGIASERELALENLTAIRRAGAQILITYFAAAAAEQGWLT